MQSQLLLALNQSAPTLVAAGPSSSQPNPFPRNAAHVSSQKSTAVPPPQLTVAQSLACGAIARAVQIFTMFPVDTIKTRIQVARSAAPATASPAVSAATAAAATTATSNTAAAPLTRALRQGNFYNGVTVSLMGQIPYAMLSFGLYEILKSRIFDQPRLNLPPWLSITLAASIGDAIGSLWLTPTEVLKSKTQAGLFPGPLAAARGIAPSGIPAFYEGYTAALARDVPFRALQLYLFERVKTWYINRRKRKEPHNAVMTSKFDTLTPVENLLVGAVSGTITAALTTPSDVIRTRMMSQPPGQAALYSSAMDCIMKTVQREGAGAMLKGLGPRVVLIGPSSAVFFVAYEAVKSFFRKRGRRARVQAACLTPLRRMQNHG